MRRIFWDTMLFIYLLEGDPVYQKRVTATMQMALERQDRLFTSWLAIGEVMAGAERLGSPLKRSQIEAAIRALPFEQLVFDGSCVPQFGRLLSMKVAVADAVHLSCAAAAGMDLFLTNDKALHKLHVPGIHFIAGLDLQLQ